MSQNDFTIANQTFPNTRADINSALQALASTSSGSSGSGQGHSHNMSANFSGSGNASSSYSGSATSVLQPYLTLIYIIKT